jgi:hypothetical protein
MKRLINHRPPRAVGYLLGLLPLVLLLLAYTAASAAGFFTALGRRPARDPGTRIAPLEAISRA